MKTFTEQLNREHDSILFIDVEILKCPDSQPGYECCNGWQDFENMGISVIGYCLDTIKDDRQWKNRKIIYGNLYFTQDSYKYLWEIIDKPIYVVGFNSIAFDDKLINSNKPAHYKSEFKTDFDLLCEIRKALGYPPNYIKGITPKGYSLEDLARVNLSYRKTGTGANAPKLWQDGKHSEVIDCCMNDVKILVDLYWLFVNGELKDPSSVAKHLIIPDNLIPEIAKEYFIDITDLDEIDKHSQHTLNRIGKYLKDNGHTIDADNLEMAIDRMFPF